MARKFPGSHLILQLVKQITQPLSKTIVKHARKQPFFRKYFLVKMGHFYYWCQSKIKSIAERDIRRPKTAARKRPVNDVRAMELGTQMLLEILIFGFLGGVVMYETSKSAEKSRIVEEEKEKELSDLEVQKERLIHTVENQTAIIKNLKEFIDEYSHDIKTASPKTREESENTTSNN